MPEQLQKIIDRVVTWWKKFNNKQRALMLSLTAIVIVALVILYVVVTKPSYTTLIDCENTKEASQVKDLLDSDGTIDYKVSNSTHFDVNVKDESAANMLLGSNDIATAGYSLSGPDLSSVVMEVCLRQKQTNRNYIKITWKKSSQRILQPMI